jgi:hypothetical protein
VTLRGFHSVLRVDVLEKKKNHCSVYKLVSVWLKLIRYCTDDFLCWSCSGLGETFSSALGTYCRHTLYTPYDGLSADNNIKKWSANQIV